ncbi:MAG: RtcB family protein, partial [Planctomycetes bacterium]|nr:RtcB family protein [Planctomycetota bacterium]
MKNEPQVKLWLAQDLPSACEAPLRRLARAEGVVRVAVLPDVHFAESVCVGVAMATRDRIYPQAVGGDIGCGMATVALRPASSSSSARDDPGRTVPGTFSPGSKTPVKTFLAPYVRDPRRVFDALYAAVAPRRPGARGGLAPEHAPGRMSDGARARLAGRGGRNEFA